MTHVPVIGIGRSHLWEALHGRVQRHVQAQDVFHHFAFSTAALKLLRFAPRYTPSPVRTMLKQERGPCFVRGARVNCTHRKKTRDLSLGIVVATTVAGMARSELFYKQLRLDPAISKTRDANCISRTGRMSVFYAAL